MESVEAGRRVALYRGHVFAEGDWIGVDFDGVLAIHDGRFPRLGDPIPLMVDLVRGLRVLGIQVRIFTARVSHIEGGVGEGATTSTPEFAADQRRQIEAWCLEHIGEVLPVTCVKDFKMILLFDDRCVQMIPNTGQALEERLGV